VENQGQACGDQTEHDGGIPKTPIREPLPWRCREVLRHRHQPHVSDAPAIKVASRGVMTSMGAPPILIGVKVKMPAI